jgi:hypothetical protein
LSLSLGSFLSAREFTFDSIPHDCTVAIAQSLRPK